MRLHYFALFSIFILSSFTTVKDDADSLLSVTIKNIQHGKGAIYIAVFNSENDFMKNHITQATVDVNSVDNLEVDINLPYGEYALTVFHDVNGNKELNTNLIGIPKEPYGFSNNPSTSFGPPKYKKAAFNFSSAGQKMEIELK